MLRIQTTPALVLIVLAGCAATHPPLLHDKIRVIQTTQVDEVEAAERLSTPLRSLARTTSSGDIFAGTDRRDPKTSVATGGLKSFSTIAGPTSLVS